MRVKWIKYNIKFFSFELKFLYLNILIFLFELKKNFNFLDYTNKNFSLPVKKKKFSILRSVFVDTKSKEHFGFYTYSCFISVDFIIEINLRLRRIASYFCDLIFENFLKNLIKFREINLNYQKIKIFTDRRRFIKPWD